VLTTLLKKYDTWWSFKSNSLLKTYLEDQGIYLQRYFCPQDLCDAIIHVAQLQSMIDPGNSNFIVLDSTLHECFKSCILYIPELSEYCQNHVTEASVDLVTELQNNAILNDLHIETPSNIIFNDPSSQFWLHPEINTLLNHAQVTYTWKELNSIFIDFCTTNKTYFTRVNDCIYQINSSSKLYDIFKFKYFHLSQVEDILKKVTLFLGKKNTLRTSCSLFQTTLKDNSFFQNLDYSINVLNKFLPDIYTPIYI